MEEEGEVADDLRESINKTGDNGDARDDTSHYEALVHPN